MKKLLVKLFCFAMPFIVLAFIIQRIDPYNYFSHDLHQEDSKKKIARKINGPLWKLIEYNRNPKPNILLGDSRMGRLKSEDILEITGVVYYNLAYEGGTLQEMINSFWYAAETLKLKNVYFGISFNHFNMHNDSKDRVTSALQVIKSPLLYLVNRNVLSATIHLIRDKITGKTTQVGKPSMTREKFWNYNLNVPTQRYYANYRYPKKWYEELRSISEFCRKNEINFKILILPTHTQLQAKIHEYGLSHEYEVYLEDLSKLTEVYNFNIKNHWTMDKDNFADPRHFKSKLAREVIREIWNEEKNWVRVTSGSRNSNH